MTVSIRISGWLVSLLWCGVPFFISGTIVTYVEIGRFSLGAKGFIILIRQVQYPLLFDWPLHLTARLRY